MSITPAQARARFQAVADQMLSIVRDIEQAEGHNGGKCLDCRINTLAYMGEQLGLLPLRMVPVDPELEAEALKKCQESSDE